MNTYPTPGLCKRVAALTLSVLMAATMLMIAPPRLALASTTGDAGGYDDPNYAQTDNANATKVSWNGYTWDIVGYNTGSRAHGIASPTGTATLLLDKSSSEWSTTFQTAFDSTEPYSNVYVGSDLQAKAADFYGALADKAGVVPRNLAGGSALYDASVGYTGNTVAGDAAAGQQVWPLSTTEASQLKASVRSNGDGDWWLRSPGSGAGNAAYIWADGVVFLDGGSVISMRLLRPALHLDLAASVFAPSLSAMDAGTLNIGAYDETLRVTDSSGYTWDVVGVNSASLPANRGIATPQGYATLLLSISSAEKFGFPVQGHTGKTSGQYNGTSPYYNDYSGSNLQVAVTSAYDAIKDASEYSGKVLLRDLEGGAVYDDGSEGVAGAAAANQGLWPLSAAETLAEVRRLDPSMVYVVGGTAVVDDLVIEAIKAELAPPSTVTRLGGGDRYTTAQADR